MPRLFTLLPCLLHLFVLGYAMWQAYEIRLYAIKTFGFVIHEFDPWFNYRATLYLAEYGWHNFFRWYDTMSWYPLGRPIGTTIYPGMQITSVVLWRALGLLQRHDCLNWWSLARRRAVTLNDVCCLVPAWGGSAATLFLSLLTYECANSKASAAMAAVLMSMMPAHLMRSVAGGYDNESVAVTAMCLTFWIWCKSLSSYRGKQSSFSDCCVFSCLAGISYAYMVAAWGGFVFVLNLIAAHVAVLVLLSRYSHQLRVAYSLFYVIGTSGAMLVPVVGWRPLRDAEQVPALAAFVGINCLYLTHRSHLHPLQRWLRYMKVGLLLFVCLMGPAIFLLYPRGYFGPISARVRGLFVKHTLTGNPLVDSVAEHQPANTRAYKQYLHDTGYYLAPSGFVLSFLSRHSDALIFLWVYGLVALYFCNKMARLMILLGPVASAFGGIALGFFIDQFLCSALNLQTPVLRPSGQEPSTSTRARTSAANDDETATEVYVTTARTLSLKRSCVVHNIWDSKMSRLIRLGLFSYVAYNHIRPRYQEFEVYSNELAEALSQPSIMFKGRLPNGDEVIVDDYRQAYLWLKENTSEDARILAWWDYGYQITGIGERTTLADGNTWNHEHIATLGRILTAPEKEAHSIAKHLADYVLVWAGGGGDDLAKSPHMARIGNSVYHDFCPLDPTCAHFGFTRNGQPSNSMRASLLFNLIQTPHRLNKTRWQHVYTSRFGKVQIFKIKRVSLRSKKWIRNETNRVCASPGSWYCQGQYPPAIKWLIDKRKPFRQLEDFNAARDEASEKYTEEYHRRLAERSSRLSHSH